MTDLDLPTPALLNVHFCMVPWSQRFSFTAKRRDKREKEAARENLC